VKTRGTTFLVVLALLALGLSGCGDDDSGATTAATTATTTATTAAPTTTAVPATTTTAAPGTTQAATTTNAPATTAAPVTTMGSDGAVGNEIEVTLVGDRISVAEIIVTAGEPVTIIVTDIDTETDDPHNFHVRAGDLNFFTMIEPAPNEQTLNFTIDTPGTYEFFCDTHALTMKGVLIVEDNM